MRWTRALERLARMQVPFFRNPPREHPPETDGWVEIPVQPELFATFSEPLDTVCPTPWNILGLAIVNQFPELEENHDHESKEERRAATIN